MLTFTSATGQYQKIPVNGFDLLTFPQLEMPWLMVVESETMPEEDIMRLKQLLNEDELVKSGRFHFQRDRESYIITHGLLRYILGTLLKVPPREVKFTTNNHGKPYAVHPRGNIFFNLSHSSGTTVMAFDKGYELGVDLEKIRQDFDYQPIVQRFFTDKENSYINEPGKQGFLRFYKLWTRKEAFLKALAIGITENLDVEVFRRRNYLDLKDKGRYGLRSTEFLLKTMRFRDDYLISVAARSTSGRIDAYLLRDGLATVRHLI